MEKVKRNFFKSAKLAIFNVEKYQDLALEKPSVAVKYFMKLILILTIVISLSAVGKFAGMAIFLVDTFESEFPDFTFSNSTLVSDDKVNTVKEDKYMKMKLIVDTNTESEEEINKYITELSDYSNGAIFLKDKLILAIDGIAGQTTYNYADFDTSGWNEITKQSVEATIANVNMGSIYTAFFISIAIYMYVVYLISTIMEIALIALIGYLTTKIVKANLKFSQVGIMSIYAVTLSVLLSAIYTPIRLLTGFNMEYFSVMYTLIPYIYIITAILLTRSELIKQQVEIGEIEKVQEQVKEELEEEKRRELEEKEKAKKKEKQDKKEKEKEEGGEPEGSEA